MITHNTPNVIAEAWKCMTVEQKLHKINYEFIVDSILRTTGGVISIAQLHRADISAHILARMDEVQPKLTPRTGAV